MKVAIGLLLGALLTACASVDTNQPLPFLPLLAPPPPGTHDIALTASFGGKLVVDRGCVKLAAGQHLTTMLWHRGTELGRDASGLFLRETHIGRVVRFGKASRFGGGKESEASIAQAYPEVARRCGPPYASGWIPELRDGKR